MTTPIQVSFPQGKRVDVRVGHHVVATDQPLELGGTDTAPGAFELFLASIAACAGTYALAFCQARSLSTGGLGVQLNVDTDPESHLPTTIDIHVTLPLEFPERYRAAILRAVENCKVKKSVLAGPRFNVDLAAGQG